MGMWLSRPSIISEKERSRLWDYNVVIGLSFIYSAMYIGIMLVVDLLYGIIDPRIRLAKGDD